MVFLFLFTILKNINTKDTLILGSQCLILLPKHTFVVEMNQPNQEKISEI